MPVLASSGEAAVNWMSESVAKDQSPPVLPSGENSGSSRSGSSGGLGTSTRVVDLELVEDHRAVGLPGDVGLDDLERRDAGSGTGPRPAASTRRCSSPGGIDEPSGLRLVPPAST